jgi:hypothetical protein
MPAKKPSPSDAASVAARNAHRAEFAAAPSDALFPVATIATVACTTPKTLEAWRAIGRGPSWVRVGRSVRYRRRDVEAWLSRSDSAADRAACEQPATPTGRSTAKPPTIALKRVAAKPLAVARKGGKA